ncbi:MAG: acetyltransferase [Bacteroides sp.]|nr:acetyltransferase [Bacteroides sp.]
MNIFGASGHAKVIADIIRASGDMVGEVFDDLPEDKIIDGRKVYSPKEKDVEGPMIIAIGSNKIRRLLAERYEVDYAKALHPNTSISSSVEIGNGSVVMAGVVIEADTLIGKHCIINTSSSINHECRVGDFVHISPNATLCGGVEVGEGSWVGAGAVVIQGIRIGKNCMVGAGAVVIRDVPDGTMVVGNPGRRIR